MSLHDILLTVQYLTAAALFTEMGIVFVKWRNPIHSYLFLACTASFISNMGYLLELKAGTEEAYLTALKLSYVGRVWIVFAFFLFTARMCKIRIPRGLISILVLSLVGIYLSVLTVESNRLYYTSYEFVEDPVFPKFYHTNGYMHDLLMGLNGFFIGLSLYWVFAAFRREKSRTPRLRLLMLILSFGVQSAFFLLQITGVFSVSQYYDLSMPGALSGTVFLLIGIFKFDLMGTREIARDFVIDRISEGIIVVDKDGRIQYYNEPAAKLYPEFDIFYKPGITGKASNNNYTPYDIVAFIDEAVRRGDSLRIDDRIYTPEGNDLLYKGENYGRLYALVDDTEHYHYMEELQKQRDIADSANAAKSRFLANMSHEIRTPINAVLGMDEMILRESKEKTIRSYAVNIKSAGRSLLSLINDILDLSKVEEGKMEILPVQYELSALIGDLVNMTRERAEKKGLQFDIRVDEHIPHLLYGDEIRIKQCVANLLTNAVKYTETGGVTLSVSYEKADPEHVLLRIKVKDSGIGMKREDMEKLFSPYERIEETRNRAIEGTGLGMSITRQLLELMGSELLVESEYGKGSVFSFTLKQEVIKWEEIGDIEAGLNDLAELSGEYHELFHAPEAKILVIDDTEMNLTVIQGLLKRTGIRIDTALSGRDGAELAADNLYDAVFIDHMMSDMDGIETLREIRREGRSKDAPAIALTANAVSGAREMYLKAGFTDYLSKPVDGEKLERMLERLLPPEKTFRTESKEEQDIDEQTGLENCGSLKGYLSVLTVFHQTAAAKADEIETLYREGDLSAYTIKVHALKSSARIIGAASLSELARSLEDAGKREDIVFIQNNTDRLLAVYRALDAELSWLDGAEGEDLPKIGEKALQEAYQTILEIATSMDYGLMEELLKSLRRYRLPAADRERIAGIEAKLTELDWDGIIKTVQEVL